MDGIAEKELERYFVFTDDVMFGNEMEDPEIALEFLRIMGPFDSSGLVVEPERQKDFKRGVYARGVRLDLLPKTNDCLYAIEIQTGYCSNRMKLMLFAQCTIVSVNTKPGMDYNEFPNSCVIFISKENICRKGKPSMFSRRRS